jgi:hypothetical protein
MFLKKIFGNGGIDLTSVAAANNPYGPATLNGIIYHLGRRMLTYADWQLLWFVFAMSIVLFWQKIWHSKLKYLLLLIILNLLLVIYGFSGQATYNYLVDGTLVQRMLMYQVPAVLFFVALAVNEL